MPQPDKPNPLLMEEIPQTLDQLRATVEKLFHCMTGPPMAYFEIALEPGDPQPHEKQEDPRFVRMVYVKLAATTHQKRTNQVEAKLVMALLEPFLDARRQLLERGDCNALLFWRQPLEIFEKGSNTAIQCRVAIPGVSLKQYEVHEGCQIPIV